jgi:DNA polymerase-3 subunit delta
VKPTQPPAGARAPFHVLICPDPELLRRKVAELAEAAGGEFTRRAYYGDEDLPPAFWQDLGSPSLLGGEFLVVLRRAEELKAPVLKELSARLCAGPGAGWPLVCIEASWEKGRPKVPAALAKAGFYVLAEKRGWLWSSPGLTERSLPAFVKDWAAAKGFRLGRGVGEALVRLLPEDAGAAANELAKVELALGGRTEVAMADLELVRPAGSEMDFYQFLEAVQSGRPRPEVWAEVLGGGAERGFLFRLITNLQMDLRAAWMIAHGEGGLVKLPPWLKDKKARLAERLAEADFIRIWNLVLEAELSVKSGERGEEQALEMLVAGLFEVFAPQKPVRPGRAAARTRP